LLQPSKLIGSKQSDSACILIIVACVILKYLKVTAMSHSIIAVISIAFLDAFALTTVLTTASSTVTEQSSTLSTYPSLLCVARVPCYPPATALLLLNR
jgi:hypothetical protein